MSDTKDARSEWVMRVLGIDVGGKNAGEPQAAALSRPARSLSLRAVAKCRLEWVSTVREVRSQAQRLKAVVMQELRDSEEFTPEQLSEADSKLAEIDTMVVGIDESLVNLLDDVVQAEPGPKRLLAQQAALAQTAKFLQFATNDEAFDLVDENEYLVTNVKAITIDGLNAIQQTLADAA